VAARTELVVLGGDGLVGKFLAALLSARGEQGVIVSRRQIAVPDGFRLIPTPELREGRWMAPRNAVVLSTWPIWHLQTVLAGVSGARQIIALGSTSLFGKADSKDSAEASVVKLLRDGEARLREQVASAGQHWTILRPTLIYDGKSDGNVTQIARLLVRCGLFVIAGKAIGRRQPIHAEDVARAMIASIDRQEMFDCALNIGGGEILSYRQMVDRIHHAVGGRGRVIALPLALCRLLVRFVHLFGIKHVSAGMFERMADDLIFDDDQSASRLGITMRGFQPEFRLN
jgi:nucleoside-diphosphate-sugar epimerase